MLTTAKQEFHKLIDELKEIAEFASTVYYEDEKEKLCGLITNVNSKIQKVLEKLLELRWKIRENASKKL